jgi:hypothetical protein
MSACGGLDYLSYFGVALGANCPLISNLLFRQVSTMRVVACQAHPGLERHVKLGSFQSLLHIIVTIKTEL